MNRRQICIILSRVFFLMIGIFFACMAILYQTDTLTLWSVLPGIHSSKEVREFSNGLVSIVEQLPEDEDTRNVVLSFTVMGAVASAAQTAQESGIDDQMISQYALGLVRARLLQKQGEISIIEYQLLKLPFKTGNTTIMKLALPKLQERVNLPDGFMSPEQILNN